MGTDWRMIVRALLERLWPHGGDVTGDGRHDDLERLRREQERLRWEQERQRRVAAAVERRVRGLQEQVTVLVQDGE